MAPDLRTQLRAYTEQMDASVSSAEEMLAQFSLKPQPEAPVQLASSRLNRAIPRWVAAGAGALGVLLLIGGTAWVLRATGNPPAATDEATPSTTLEGMLPRGARRSAVVDDVSFTYTTPGGHPSFGSGPSGWERHGGFRLHKSIVGPQPAEAIIFWAQYPANLDDDLAMVDDAAVLCEFLVYPPVATLEMAAERIATVAGVERVSGPSDVTVDGYPAKHIELLVTGHEGCDPGYYYNWRASSGGAMWVKSLIGDSINVWLVDVEGTFLFIAGETRSLAPQSLVDEIHQFVASIRFG